MRIGILTFHTAQNYGAFLQAYGLQKYLQTCGHHVELIDYRPHYFEYYRPVFPAYVWNKDIALLQNTKRLLKFYLCKFIRELPQYQVLYRRYMKFVKSTQKFMCLSNFSFMNYVDSIDQYDAIVFGSDQIWSPDHTEGGDRMFIGDFKTPSGVLKIAYAASAGASSSSLGDNPFYTNAVNNFDAISVREKILGDALQKYYNKTIQTVLDPTLLAAPKIWNDFAQTPKRMPQKYVLIYQVSYNKEANRIAGEIADELGAEVVSIWSGYYLDEIMRQEESPEEFVGWFKNAACVVTTSFHGTAFSLIFEKPFYFVGSGLASENRQKQVLDNLGLMDRFIYGDVHVKYSDIDFNNPRLRLDEQRVLSRKFLQESLENVDK